jgi:hypothetical protein
MSYLTRRNTADGIMDAVESGGPITIDTLKTLIELLGDKTNYPFHIEVAVLSGAVLKTIDNEKDAQETIQRLQAKVASK